MRQKFFAWREEVRGSTWQWFVCEHPDGGQRRHVINKPFMTAGAADRHCARMNADWERYQRAMWEKADGMGWGSTVTEGAQAPRGGEDGIAIPQGASPKA